MQQISLLLACSLIVCSPVRAADDGVRLIYRLPESEVFRYDASSTLTQQFSMMDVEMTSLVTTDLELKVTVAETVLSRSTVDVTYDHGRITTRLIGIRDMPPQDTTVDLQTVRDLKLRMTIAPDGKVITSSIEAAHEDSKQIMTMLRSTRLFDRLFTEFPNKPVLQGDSWKLSTRDTTLAPQGLGQVITESTINLTYRGTRDTLGRSCWVVDFTSQGVHQFGEFSRGDIQMSLEGDGTFIGTSYHDVTTGALVASHSELATIVTMSFTGQQQTSVPVESHIILDLHQPKRAGK